MIATDGHVLAGNWRRRSGTRTDAHLYAGSYPHPFDQRPMCDKAIRYLSTVAVTTGRPCYDCLVATITARTGAHPTA